MSVDGIVIERERWTFPRGELAFADAGDTLKRFVAARRWAKAAGLPRFVFAKTPEDWPTARGRTPATEALARTPSTSDGSPQSRTS
ncbi:MAG: hypothetical protein ACYC8T_15670, partial [Myxococcaceae bacterium]